MGTGTKIGIVLIMVLVVVVIANLLDSEVQNGPTAEEQVTGVAPRDFSIPPGKEPGAINNGSANRAKLNSDGSARRTPVLRPVTPLSGVIQKDPIGPKDAPLMNTIVGGAKPEPALARTDQVKITPAAGVIRNQGGIEPVVATHTNRIQKPTGVQTSVAKPVPSTRGATTQFKVRQGDSLWKIAARELGAGTRWVELLEVNPGLTETTKLYPGAMLNIPGKDRSTVVKRPVTPQAPAVPARSGMRLVLIRDGDTLYDIARDELGNGGRWLEIQNLNDGLNPNALPIGKKIWIPR
ncbi:MAG: LysM peptidoglycan-binding domain-containing protein [Planctomycetota bacterium]|nr:LysM peptidoglycan-binding domain-containing protein [Planctomycetota bacterium]